MRILTGNSLRANCRLIFADTNQIKPFFMSITLYIARHAKAEDRAVFMPDFDRKLTSEGVMAAARMGRFLKGKGILPEAVISSPAPRASETAKVIAEQIGYDLGQIEFNEKLYEGGPKAYLASINALPATVQSAMIVGHNPDVSYLAEFLTHQSIGSMSKGAVVAVTFEDAAWAEIAGRTGNVAFTIAPKQLKNE